MKNLIKLLVATCFALALPVVAASGDAPPKLPQERAALQACPPPGTPLLLSQVSQADCCKGHKGVCGCRAGKIVCCDGTVSPNCTCHADSGFEN